MSNFEWSDFFKVGKKLKNGDEASKRTAISRFYYAAFGSSREYLTEVLNESQYLSRKDIHSKVLKRFQESLYPDENSIHPLLLKLRSERNKADYSKLYVPKNINAREKDSKEILKKVEELNKNPSHKRF